MQTVEWIEISKALITPAIASLGAWIAFSQYNSNELKRRHELFEKRWEMYTATLAFMNDTIMVGEGLPFDFSKSKTNYLRVTAAAQYIFGEDVKTYIHNLVDQCDDIAKGARKLEYMTDSYEECDSLKAEVTRKKHSLHKEEFDRCNAVFAKYMQLENHAKITVPAVLAVMIWPIKFFLTAFNKQNWIDAFRKNK